jgi:hypothetical protein
LGNNRMDDSRRAFFAARSFDHRRERRAVASKWLSDRTVRENQRSIWRKPLSAPDHKLPQ